MHLLVVEDDDAIAVPLMEGLERAGFTTTWAANGSDALAKVRGADLVLLDLGLPDLDGSEVCRRLRATSTVPIIIVTGARRRERRVLGLELGADDYIVKPFGSRELIARVRAVARRSNPTANVELPQLVGPLTIDRRTHRVHMEQEEIDSRRKSSTCLSLLAEDPARSSAGSRSWTRSGIRIGTARRRRSTSTSRRSARRSETTRSSRPCGRSAFDYGPTDAGDDYSSAQLFSCRSSCSRSRSRWPWSTASRARLITGRLQRDATSLAALSEEIIEHPGDHDVGQLAQRFTGGAGADVVIVDRNGNLLSSGSSATAAATFATALDQAAHRTVNDRAA